MDRIADAARACLDVSARGRWVFKRQGYLYALENDRFGLGVRIRCLAAPATSLLSALGPQRTLERSAANGSKEPKASVTCLVVNVRFVTTTVCDFDSKPEASQLERQVLYVPQSCAGVFWTDCPH